MTVMAVVLIALTAVAFYTFAPMVGIGVGVLAFASAAGATTVETPTTGIAEAASPEILAMWISKKITEMKPAATPLDTILRNVGLVVPVKAWKTEWYSSDVRGIADSISTAFDTSASGTVDSTGAVNTITVHSIHIWNVDDVMMVQGINGGDGKELILHVVSKNNALHTLGVITVNGLGADEDLVPDLPEDTVIVRIGNAKSELDAQTAPYTTFPQKSYNYCQTHMAQVEESLFLELHAKNVNWGMTDYRAQALYDLRRSFELTSLFGARGLKHDPEGQDDKYFSGGIYRYAGETIEYMNGSLAQGDFNTWAKTIFTGNAGSDQRILFAGKELMVQIANITTVQKQLEAKATEVMFGVTFNKITTNFGEILIKHHNLFNDVGWSYNGMVLDVNNIERHVFKPMAVNKILLKESGQKNANAFMIDETFCVATRYPATHFIIEPSGSTAP